MHFSDDSQKPLFLMSNKSKIKGQFVILLRSVLIIFTITRNPSPLPKVSPSLSLISKSKIQREMAILGRQMCHRLSSAVLFFVLIQANVFAYQYQVGNLQAWNVPTSTDPKIYTNWPKKLNFRIGDSLLFLYPPSEDSVIQVTKESYDTCNLKNPILYMNNGNSLFNITSPGVFYFTSGVSGHCEKSQKIQISVFAADGSLPLPPSSAPGGALADSAPSYPTVFGGIPSGPTKSSSSTMKVSALISAAIRVVIWGFVGGKM